MGIVINQSIKNTMATYFGFGIGAVNALFLYTHFLGKMHYGITAFILSGANILMPVMAFGAHNTLVRFYSHCKSAHEKESFLSFMLWMPLLFILPCLLLIWLFYDALTGWITRENPMVEPFLWLIPIIGICMAYFEIFYAWAKVHMKSVLGNFISEVLVRVVIMFLLFGVYQQAITKDTFIYCTAGAYALQLLAMMAYAFYIKRPKLHFEAPENLREIVGYSLFIILSGSVAVLLLDFDKVMIPAYQDISSNALYSVAIFIATVIAVPSRAMLQIIYPITARLMNERNYEELDVLYKKSAISLQVFGGLIMLGIFLNIKQMYLLIPAEYNGGILVVFLIGLSKFSDLILGNNNAIILSTKYYRSVLLFGILLVVMMVVLNMILIPLYGIDGAAMATLISILVYNAIKLFFVTNKLGLFPFTFKTVESLLIIVVVFVLFYFWDFNFHPVINIALKSILITALYSFAHYRLKISPEINRVIDQGIAVLRKK